MKSGSDFLYHDEPDPRKPWGGCLSYMGLFRTCDVGVPLTPPTGESAKEPTPDAPGDLEDPEIHVLARVRANIRDEGLELHDQ